MGHVDNAIDECASYEQVGPNRWRASITGVVVASSEAETPSRSLMQLKRAIDLLLSSLLRRVGPFTGKGYGASAAFAPEWEKLLTAETTRVAVSDKPK